MGMRFGEGKIFHKEIAVGKNTAETRVLCRIGFNWPRRLLLKRGNPYVEYSLEHAKKPAKSCGGRTLEGPVDDCLVASPAGLERVQQHSKSKKKLKSKRDQITNSQMDG